MSMIRASFFIGAGAPPLNPAGGRGPLGPSEQGKNKNIEENFLHFTSIGDGRDGMFVFVSGAVRSGKSEWAERAAMELSPFGQRVYLATARVLDDEMRRRVDRHQASRQGRGFTTLERPRDLEGVLPALPRNATVLLECLGNWLANELFGDTGGMADAERAVTRIRRTALRLRDRTANLLIVSNDLFGDGLRYDAETETYLRSLGTLHVLLAKEADAAVECVAGQPRPAKGRMPDALLR